MGGKKYRIFISYSRKQKALAELIEKRLRRRVKNLPWRDVINLEPGEDWASSIDRALLDAGVLIVVVSSASRKADYVNYEWAFALGAGKKVLPLLAEELSPLALHPVLRRLGHIRFDAKHRDWTSLFKALASGTSKENRLRVDSSR